MLFIPFRYFSQINTFSSTDILGFLPIEKIPPPFYVSMEVESYQETDYQKIVSLHWYRFKNKVHHQNRQIRQALATNLKQRFLIDLLGVPVYRQSTIEYFQYECNFLLTKVTS